MRFGAVENVQHDNGHANGNPARQPNLEAVSAQAARFLEQAPVGELVGAKLSRLVDAFLHTDVLPQARRAADLGIDPTPLLAVTAEVLRVYADALHPHEVARTDRRVRLDGGSPRRDRRRSPRG